MKSHKKPSVWLNDDQMTHKRAGLRSIKAIYHAKITDIGENTLIK